MKAAVWYGHKDVRVEERQMPIPKQGEVRIRVAWAGICGTDKHEYLGPLWIPVDKPHRLTGETAPLVQGHEYAGIIDAVGEGVTEWKAGDRVTASGSLVCGECEFCKTGRKNICEKLGFIGVGKDGGFAEYVAIPEHQLFLVPENVTLKEAALTEPIACGVHATQQIGDLTGKTAAIVGPGMIGLSCLIAAKAAGADPVYVIGQGEGKREFVETFGGIYIDGRVEDPIEGVRTRNGDLVDVSYEAVGLEPTLDLAVNLLRCNGTLMIMGVFSSPPRINMNLIQEGERVIKTSQANVNEIQDVLELIAAEKLDPMPLVTGEATLDRIVEDGFEAICAKGNEHVKILVEINDGLK
jgi:(R,R)-butanediol dehydrogenase/meso-butanediol dehydrogenase/diacetyl reductase